MIQKDFYTGEKTPIGEIEFLALSFLDSTSRFLKLCKWLWGWNEMIFRVPFKAIL